MSSVFSISEMGDFFKEFDIANHNILLNKLCKIGIRDHCLRWICSYLRNRTQLVTIEGAISLRFTAIIYNLLN